MNDSDPLKKSEADFQDILKKISSDSSVGIDARLTHAIIIDYLQQLTQRIDKIEKIIRTK